MPAERTFSFVVPASLEETEAALKAATRFRIFPSIAAPLASQQAVLGGRAGQRFRVSLSQPDLMRRLQPLAIGTLTATPQGTRVEGTAGLPPWLTWYLRVAFILIGLVAAALVANGALSGAPLASYLPLALGVLLVGGLLGAVSIGEHIRHADQQVDALVHGLEQGILRGLPAATAATPTAAAQPTTPTRPRSAQPQ